MRIVNIPARNSATIKLITTRRRSPGLRVVMCPIGTGALGTSERNVRFGYLVVESRRYHES
jgi:hypothetical protein